MHQLKGKIKMNCQRELRKLGKDVTLAWYFRSQHASAERKGERDSQGEEREEERLYGQQGEGIHCCPANTGGNLYPHRPPGVLQD